MRANWQPAAASDAEPLTSLSRAEQVGSGGNTAAYGYLANSPLVEHIWFTNGSTLRMTTTKQYDFLNRLTRIESAAGSSNVSVSAYHYNLASQRTALTNADSSYWIYTYDPLGQVTSGKKYWSNGTPVAGQQFEYGFDDIGNRQSAASGGNATGGNLREQSYSANLLNQYTSRTVPGYVDVLGKAASAATVTVWGDQSIAKLPLGTVGPVRAERQGDYWRAEVPINNSTGAVWLTVTNWAVLNQGTNADLLSSLTGSVLVAQSPEAFTYDLDGNLTSDSLWTSVWNGENRRVTVESTAGVAGAARAREQWTFLPDGRWIERIVSTNNGSAYYPAYTNRYVWDGNVLLAVLDHTNGLQLGFTRGLDLSGTPQGAGGAGGLLWVSDPSTINHQPSTHCVCFDGNGNVMALVNLADGTTSAEYAYGPFGEPIQAIGPMARANPLRFSTQYADDVTGDVNYLFRAYTARTGRWPNRDPLGESGFEISRSDSLERRNFEQEVLWLTDDGDGDAVSESQQTIDVSQERARFMDYEWNRYAFVLNAPIQHIDAVGLDITLETGNAGAGSINNHVHQQVCVGCGDSRRCFSFGKIEGFGGVQLPQFSKTWLGWSSWVTGAILKGEIYEADPVARAKVVSRHTATPPQDSKWLQYMLTSRVGLQDGYSVARHNCRKFSQWEFRDAPLHW